MARSGLGISSAELAELARVGINTISRFEQGADARSSSLEAIRSALEAKGAVFLSKNEVSIAGGPGVRLS